MKSIVRWERRRTRWQDWAKLLIAAAVLLWLYSELLVLLCLMRWYVH